MKMNALNEWKFMSHLRTGTESSVENGKRRNSCRLSFVLKFFISANNFLEKFFMTGKYYNTLFILLFKDGEFGFFPNKN